MIKSHRKYQVIYSGDCWNITFYSRRRAHLTADLGRVAMGLKDDKALYKKERYLQYRVALVVTGASGP